MITKHASAHWQGGLKDGKGTIKTESGALKDLPYGFKARFEGEPGTNPEELIAAAHAGCYSMALSMILGLDDMVAQSIDTKADVTLDKVDDGFAITKVHLSTQINVPDADKAAVEACAQKAKAGCPISKVLNAEITLSTEITV